MINSALVGVLALMGGGTWYALHPSSASADSATTARTATVATGDVKATISASGNLAAATTANEKFSTSGTIATIAVSVGDVVTAGQVLATLDATDAQNAVTQAEASVSAAEQQRTTANLQLTAAKQSLAEAQTALATTVTSTDPTTGTTTTTTKGSESQVTSAKAQVSSATSQVTQANAQVTSAEAALATAKADLAGTTLTASMPGTVTAVNGAVGDSSGGSSSGSTGTSSSTSSSTTSTGLITIADTSVFTVSAAFAEADAAQLSVGQVADVTFPAVPGVTATAKVTAISPSGTTTNSVVTYAATITLDSAPAGVRLGQTADVSVTTASASGVLYLPSQAVTVGTTDAASGTTSGTVTLVGADGSRTVTQVVVGVQGDSTTQIVSGVKAGDKALISLDTAIGTTTSTTTTGGLSGLSGGGMPAGGFPGGAPGGNG